MVIVPIKSILKFNTLLIQPFTSAHFVSKAFSFSFSPLGDKLVMKKGRSLTRWCLMTGSSLQDSCKETRNHRGGLKCLDGTMEAVWCHVGLGWLEGITNVGEGDIPVADPAVCSSFRAWFLSTGWPSPASLCSLPNFTLFMIQLVSCCTRCKRGLRKFGCF